MIPASETAGEGRWSSTGGGENRQVLVHRFND